jgi:hypothetical protein
MDAIELALRVTCREFGVSKQEVRYGSQRRIRGERNLQLTVSLARSSFLWRCYWAGADASAVGPMMRLSTRSVRKWFADFRARAA